MHDGGTEENSAGADIAAGDHEGPTRPLARLRKHWLLTSAVALALLGTGTAVPIVLADSGDDTPCQEIPAATRALAKDPAAATRALDPGDDLSRYDAVRALLVHENPCGDGGEVLGQVAEAATRAAADGGRHTLAQARAAYAVVAAYEDEPVPRGAAPGVARVLAEYVVDVNRFLSADREAYSPAVDAVAAAPDDTGWTTYGRFLAPGEAHADFEHSRPYSDVRADPEDLIGQLAADPEAFAILYDAERAYFAYYLERLTRNGADPDYHPGKEKDGAPKSATTWTDIDLEHLTDRIGALMSHRALYARDGTIPDLAAFDKAVRRHTRGAYRAADRQVSSRPPMGDIAERPVSGAVSGDLMDGRHQLFTVLDAWTKTRSVPTERAAQLRQLIDDRYVRALWLTRY
ncbi:hypothetical protein DI272_43045 [Streptomyces sp. Act143]|uniref:hypothetical protein n=1 Tax=Streptomyces sp. Act143 TaxID=2200760 RepID=UPI000D681AF3|nr:hypothetical protein [Streptomyces sp. Act143]PWI20186.1 hypothetical protein DI272_43045 [Streptomyces sp. Act143]